MRDSAGPSGTVPYGVMQERAKAAVEKGIKDGVLVRQPCELCGKAETLAHHDDYSRPLDVRWLCRSHHTLVHNELNAERAELPLVRSPDPITVRRLRQTISQIGNPVMVVTLKDGQYIKLGLWIPARRIDAAG